MSRALDEIKIGGLGASHKRVEDSRFIRGKGNYTDDITLPGMLHMEILRSPLAHARIASIDASKAWHIPGVHLVLTGEMMATRNLAWMPTLSYDTQAVLATDKVRFQGQEVACVIADDPYIAKDACEAIDVDYEPLPAIVSPQQAVAEGAPVIRDDKDNQRDNVIYDWEVGDKAGTDRAFEQADVISKLKLHYPRSHPSPIECCGSIADFNRATSKLTVYMTTQAPHIIRAAVALVAELPEHMIRIIAPDIGAASATRSRSTPATSARSCWSARSSGSRTSRATSSRPASPGTSTWTARWRCAATARSSASGCTPRPTTARSSPTPSPASSRSG